MNKHQQVLLVTTLVAIDQVIKWLVMTFLTSTITIIPGFLTLNYLQNYGIGFSLLNGNRIFILFLTAGLMYAIYRMLKNPEFASYNLALLLIFAGGIGNLIDRLIHGFVVDYIDVMIFNYDFPVFNFADSILVCGAILIIAQTLYEEMRKNG